MARKPKPNPLVDEFAVVRAQKRELEKRYNELRIQLVAVGKTVIVGEKHTAFLIERSRSDLDRDSLKADFGMEWYNSYCKDVDYVEIEIANA